MLTARTSAILAALLVGAVSYMAPVSAGIAIAGQRLYATPAAGGGGGAGTCTVNFLDSLSYTKPYCRAVTVPDEASATNKYYVDYTSGGGTTCSQPSPCANLNAVAGKTGASGGPAYIYVKGNGYLSLTSLTLNGSAGNEIVVKPWPGDSTPTVWTAQGGCTRPNANTISASGVHNVIFDGGQDMLLRFVGSGCTTDQNGYTLVVSSNDITMYRVRIDANASSGPALGPAVGSGTNQSNFKIINSEIYNSKYYGVYAGGGTSCGAADTQFTNMQFLGNIIRDVEGRGIQVEPRANSDGLIVDGNAMHNTGYDRSGFSGGPSAAIQPAISCAGITANIKVMNNLVWDMGGGFDRVDFSGSPACANYEIYNNTAYDYGKSASAANKSSHGIGVDTAGECATIKGNIIENNTQPGTICAFDCTRAGSIVSAKNVCESGAGGCGSTSITASVATVFDSTSTASASFLHPNGGALDACVVIAGAETDYLGVSRGVAGATTDCGAINEP